MASITIRNLDEKTKMKLRRQAAMNGHSMEAEARAILARELNATPSHQSGTGHGLATRIHALFGPLGGLEIPPRDKTPVREPPNFE